MGNVISVINMKGGVGKTTLSIGLADILATQGYNILLMNSSLNPPFEMGDQAKPKRCLEY